MPFRLALPSQSRLFSIQWSPYKLNSDPPFRKSSSQSEAPNTFRLVTREPLILDRFRLDPVPLSRVLRFQISSHNSNSSHTSPRYANELIAKFQIRIAPQRLVARRPNFTTDHLQRQRCWRRRLRSAQRSRGSAGSVGRFSVQAQAPATSGEPGLAVYVNIIVFTNRHCPNLFQLFNFPSRNTDASFSSP